MAIVNHLHIQGKPYTIWTGRRYIKGMPVKNKIKQFIDTRGITRYQFMKEVGIAQGTAYNLYSNPDQLPASSVLTKICDAYQVQPGEIIEWVKK